MAQAKSAARKPRRKEKKNIALGQAHIKSTFNNTIVSITDPTGAVISWASSGVVGFKGSRKSTPYAAGMAAESALRTLRQAQGPLGSWACRGPRTLPDASARGIREKNSTHLIKCKCQ